jgi:hypothetical protein
VSDFQALCHIMHARPRRVRAEPPAASGRQRAVEPPRHEPALEVIAHALGLPMG